MPSVEQLLGGALYILGESTTIADLSFYTDIDEENIILTLNSETFNNHLSALGLKVLQSNDGVQLVTIEQISQIIAKIQHKELDGDLTPAQLQVMTVIAYMPGATRSDISYIRGAQSSASIRNLIMRGLIYRKAENCYVTNEALTYLGVDKVEDLPEFSKLNRDFQDKLKESLQYE